MATTVNEMIEVLVTYRGGRLSGCVPPASVPAILASMTSIMNEEDEDDPRRYARFALVHCFETGKHLVPEYSGSLLKIALWLVAEGPDLCAGTKLLVRIFDNPKFDADGKQVQSHTHRFGQAHGISMAELEQMVEGDNA